VQKIKVYELSQKCINKNLPSAFKLSTGKRKGMPSGTRVIQEESRFSPKPNALRKDMLRALRIPQIVLSKQRGRDNVDVWFKIYGLGSTNIP